MIGFVGMTHLGLVTSLAAASKGFEILAVDPVRCSNGFTKEEFYEPRVQELLQSFGSKIAFSCDFQQLRQCSLIYLSLDLSTDSVGNSDLTLFNNLFSKILDVVPALCTLVILSQVPPGTTRQCERELVRRWPYSSIRLYYQVETLIVGAAVDRAICPERIIVGCSDPRESTSGSYWQFLQSFNCPILPMSFESAELCKIAVNCFLISSITTTNFLADISASLGASWSEIATAVQLDRRIGPYAYLRPGLGLGGSNLIRDLRAVKTLADRYGSESTLLDAWNTSSSYHLNWVLRRLHDDILCRHNHPVVALWGFAYKPDTDSIVNSPALSVISALTTYTVQAYDPRAILPASSYPHVTMQPTPLDACRDADVLLILTPWSLFSSVPLCRVHQLMRGHVIIDPYSIVSRDHSVRLGFRHLVLGHQEPSQEVFE